jgi:protein TonB
MAYVDQQMSGNRMVSIVIVAIIHVIIGWLLISGLAISAFKEVAERITTVDIDEPEPEEEPEEPPPPEQDTSPPPPVAPPQPFSFRQTPDPVESTPDPPPPSPVNTDPPRPAPTGTPAPRPTPTPTPPPAVDRSAPATPDNLGRWSSQISNNYPSAALRREEEGTVGVAVQIGANGRVTACSVTRSSGSPRLDSAACQGMQRYARFNPAKDKAGNPTNGSFSTSITYRLN